ncbi:hypothetical protein ACTXT7_013416 [Hymenolepis weldensis]
MLKIQLPLTGWRATDEAVYPTAEGAMIVTTHYRLIIQWPEAIPIVNRAMQHPYLLFENPANGGTEIIVYFDDPVRIKKDIAQIRSISCRNTIRQLFLSVRMAIKRKRNTDYRLIKVLCEILFRRSQSLMLTQ